MSVKKGDLVKVEYTGSLDDGTVFDTSEGKEPFEFKVGSGQVIKGFDDAVIGMETGEEKQVKLEPTEAYGENKPDLVKKLSRERLPPENEPKPGMILELRSPDGQRIPARITEVTDNDVTIDLNHPLAGKSLNFKIKVVGIS